jgi:large subunit ribosomal protein L31
MQAEIHPEYYPVIFVDRDWELITHSTMKSNETREVNGVEHYVIKLSISSNSHPFWTGSDKRLDTEGRVERFNKKYGRNKKS